MLSWTPYTIIAAYETFSPYPIHPLLVTFAAILAKSSMIWSSVIYIFYNKQIRPKINKNLFTYQYILRKSKFFKKSLPQVNI